MLNLEASCVHVVELVKCQTKPLSVEVSASLSCLPACQPVCGVDLQGTSSVEQGGSHSQQKNQTAAVSDPTKQ